MKKLFLLMIFVALSLALVGNAYAWRDGHQLPTVNDVTDALLGDVYVPKDMVALSESGTGDLLIVPMFVAVGDFSTKLTIVNTNQNASTVAKVVLRGYEKSEEVFDFYIYLSPADMWTGHIYVAANGEVTVWSNDESMQSPSGLTWISETNEFQQRVKVQDDNWLGYITIFNVATYDQAYDDILAPARLGLQNRLADKQVIHDWFWSAGALTAIQNGFGDNRDQRTRDRNILAAWADLSFGNATPPFENLASASAAIRATALKDFNVTVRPQKRADMQIRTASNWNNLDEVEAVLSKRNAFVPFMNLDTEQSMHIFNMPTKYSQWGPTLADGTQRPASTVYLQHAAGAARQSMPYYPWVFDNKERMLDFTVSPFDYAFPYEVNLVDTGYLNSVDRFNGDLFDYGWIDYEFRNRFGNPLNTALITSSFNPLVGPRTGEILVAQGLPVLALNMHLDGNGFNFSYAANSDTYSMIPNSALPAGMNQAGSFVQNDNGTYYFIPVAVGEPIYRLDPTSDGYLSPTVVDTTD